MADISVFGKKVTVTATTQVVTLPREARTISVYNSGAADLYVDVNSTTSELDSKVSSGWALPIPANSVFDIDVRTQSLSELIETIALKSSSGSLTVYISGN